MISNHTFPGFQRNGWYLWQEDVPMSYTDIWRYQDYYNLMLLGGDGTLSTGVTASLDANTRVYVSAQATATSYGVVLNSDSTDNNSSTDYGYLKVISEKKIYGISFHISRYDENAKHPWLIVRLYDKSGKRVEIPISVFNAGSGKYGWEEVFRDDDKGYPYYVIVQQKMNTNSLVTILFDEGVQYEDIYQVILQPLFETDTNNTMVIKTITLIGDYKEHLKEYVND